jgi:hypothetical protein
MASAKPFERNRLYPKAPAPNEDVSTVQGNCSDEHKQLNMNTLAFYVGSDYPSIFAHDAVKDLKLVAMNLNKRNLLGSPSGGSGVNAEILEGQTICEITVKEGDEFFVSLRPYDVHEPEFRYA